VVYFALRPAAPYVIAAIGMFVPLVLISRIRIAPGAPSRASPSLS
jgi:hypothetical protein